MMTGEPHFDRSRAARLGEISGGDRPYLPAGLGLGYPSVSVVPIRLTRSNRLSGLAVSESGMLVRRREHSVCPAALPSLGDCSAIGGPARGRLVAPVDLWVWVLAD